MSSSPMNHLRAIGDIDAHQHFWKYDPVRHSWINDEMQAIRKDFTPEDLKPVLRQNGVTGCVAVQADQTEAETDFLLALAQKNDFIKGVVGWVDLRAANLQERLEHYQQFTQIKGFRHILQAEEPEFMLTVEFLTGIFQLHKFNFTYDILIHPRHLPTAAHLVRQLPDQQFVIDHLAKPFIKKGELGEWRKEMQIIAKFPNLHCKISGMVTEADMRNWKPADFTPYLDAVTEAFGTDRLIYGSDWPVCLAAASYKDVIGIVRNYFSSFSADEQDAIFRGNATAFYNL